jgi:hypothetical protein
MAVLHVTYKPNTDTDNVAYKGFCDIAKSYRSIRLSESNWAINIEEPPKIFWQKLKRLTKPDDYLVMFPLDASLLTAQDQRILQWILARP